jgi:hypothetical protein
VLVVDPTNASKQAFTGVVDTGGIQITNVVWTEGTNVAHTNGATIVDYETATHWALYRKGLLVSHNEDGTIKNGAVSATAMLADAIITRAKLASGIATEFTTGWLTGDLPAVSSVTNNGNRSYDVTFASTVASILTPGMRLRTQRTVAANTYMGGAFNGSSHYFTKTSPTGTLGTVTDNFTLMAVVQPTSYADSCIVGRLDATPANGFDLHMTTTGQVYIRVFNGGGANYRYIQTYQSLPLNKKTTVTAAWSSSGPTITIYFDGVAVPAAQGGVGGTNPTTAGTGGDFSIGRLGASASSYFPGYISNVAVFNAVLSAATIKQHATYKLTGSETNCIGAWALDNSASDQSAAGNNLTATGGVGYTNISPFTTDANGTPGTYDYAIVQKVSGSTVTVQVPEGCTIPTTGGISAVAYSVQKAPFGMPVDTGRWAIKSIYRVGLAQASAANGTWYNPTGSPQISIPTGGWLAWYQASCYVQNSSSVPSMYATLHTAVSEGSYDFTTRAFYGNTNNWAGLASVNRSGDINTTSATTYYLNTKTDQTGSPLLQFGPSAEPTVITAIPSNL